MPGRCANLSAFVVSFNRAGVIGTCLRALRFADEVIVVDKSSTDETPAIAARHADRVITVPWSPTADETRAFALAQCSHDWILFLDDDECLSPEAVAFIEAELAAPRADIYCLPRREYVLGTHDERAYYWPEHQIRMFRRGAVEFSATVHACVVARSERMIRVPAEGGVCIHHLSHQDVAQWVEKANRYTSCADRARVAHGGRDLAGFAHARIDYWLGLTRAAAPGGYPQAVAVLRAVYDLIDRLKVWEEERGLDGAALFAQVCAGLDAAFGAEEGAEGADRAAPRPCGDRSAVLETAAAAGRSEPEVAVTLRGALLALREEHDEAVGRLTAARDAAAGEQHRLAGELADARAALAAEQARAEAAGRASGEALQREAAVRVAAEAALRRIEASTFWRATAWPRRVVGWLKGRE
jgi:hypothetical protein